MVNTSIQLYKLATQGKLVPSPFYPTGHQISLIFASLLCHRSAISLQLYHRLCISFLVHCNDFQLISSSNDSCPSPQSSLFTCSFTLLLCNPCLHIHFSMQIRSIFLYLISFPGCPLHCPGINEKAYNTLMLLALASSISTNLPSPASANAFPVLSPHWVSAQFLPLSFFA